MTSTPSALDLALLADETPSAGSVPCGAQSLPPPSATSPSRSRSRPLRLPANHASSSSRSLSQSQSQSNSPHHHDNDSVFYLHPDTPSQLRQRFIQIQVVDQRFKHPSWRHPNVGGESQHVHAPPADVAALRDRRRRLQPNLREWPATAISGNAILSSILFSAGLTAAKAGRFAPLAQLAVVVTVYCFRFVLADVMSAVPLNGGCYTAVLNASTKRTAAVAATFSVLSYLATGVVCAVSGLTYVRSVYDPLPVVACAVALLLAFALLCLVGIAESAVVALGLFTTHVVTLVVLGSVCVVYAVQHPSVLVDNLLHTGVPDASSDSFSVGFSDTSGVSSALTALFLGFAPALLGVTGFESSAQFVEEQAPGVFPKTLRNMWALSSGFNVAFALLSLAVLPLDAAVVNKAVLLAHMGRVAGGRWLELLVTVDAFLVLSGAVLTSYVGINGLVQRLALDRVLPKFLLATNRWRGTHHVIILSYWAVASSLVVVLDGDVDTLSGVFGFAFLGVLASFALGCVLLKVHRDAIPRTHTTTWPNALFCLSAVALGLASNVVGDTHALGFFALYYATVGVVVVLMLERVRLLQAVLFASRTLLVYVRQRRRVNDSERQRPHATDGGSTDATRVTTTTATSAWRPDPFVGSVVVAKAIERIKKTPVVFFCKAPNLPKINEAVAYVLQNEQTYCLCLVHVREQDVASPREFEDIVCLFDHIYPLLKIDFVSVTGTFEPATVEWIAQSMGVPTNMMFMRQPASVAIHAVAALGVRVITN